MKIDLKHVKNSKNTSVNPPEFNFLHVKKNSIGVFDGFWLKIGKNENFDISLILYFNFKSKNAKILVKLVGNIRKKQ